MFLSHQFNQSNILVASTRQELNIIFTRTRERYEQIRSSKRLHRIIASVAFLLGFFSFLPGTSHAAVVEERTFIVTAYYSPLPDQSFYFKWSYEAEVRLNGEWTHWASGRWVFPGMLAAPKTYAFGTKIYLEWVGLGTVEDRGGAIVVAWERGYAHDRIDIWMWYGEPGLRRALLWGKRQVKGQIITDSRGYVTIDLSRLDKWAIDLAKLPLVKNTITSGASILEKLTNLGYDDESTTLEDMIYHFQLDHHIVSSRSDQWAGNYGPKTQAKLEEIYSTYLAIRAKEEAAIKASKDELLKAREAWKQEQKKAEAYISTLGSPKLWDTGNHIRELQVFLRNLGYFKGKDTGIMGSATVASLKKYQKERGLKTSGSLDQYTKMALTSDKLFLGERRG